MKTPNLVLALKGVRRAVSAAGILNVQGGDDIFGGAVSVAQQGS